jgi:hypothetical protein
MIKIESSSIHQIKKGRFIYMAAIALREDNFDVTTDLLNDNIIPN